MKFNTKSVYYEYVVMPYGLVKAQSVFLAFVNKVFWDLIGRYIKLTWMTLWFYPWNIIISTLKTLFLA